ncbi:MAG: chemotaxis protein CheW [Pseudomonadota bacterium]|nr:MAG: chemotaxis protein CheW [Pseudomonadota bacterium]
MPDLVRAPGTRIVRRGIERGPVREFLVFSLASELYGVELARIREILSPPPVTPVPRSPPEVVGVCSVRGLLVTVVDLRRKLRVEERPLGRRARILLALAQSGETIGLLVDEVKQVMRLGDGEIEPSANALGGDLSEHVLGIGRPQGMFLILLDLSAIVSS